MLNQRHEVLVLTRKVTVAVEANRMVAFSGAIATAGGTAAGPVRVKAAANDLVGVTVLGATTVEAGAAIADGAELEVGADGKVITRATGKTVAWALGAAAADGDKLEAFIVANHS